MLKAERWNYILKELKENGKVVVEEIAKELNLSPMTVRRDFKSLEEKKLIKRTHGGAVEYDGLVEEIPYHQKSKKNIKEKKLIAEYASTFVSEGSTIILDAGTTNMEIAKKVINIKNLKVITTDLVIAIFLSQVPDITVYCTGGLVQSDINACTGSETKKFLGKIYADIAFIGASSIDVEKGVTSPTFEKVEVKRQMMASAEKSILVADNEKFGKKSLAKICSLSEFDLIITDKAIDKNILEKIQQLDIQITVV